MVAKKKAVPKKKVVKRAVKKKTVKSAAKASAKKGSVAISANARKKVSTKQSAAVGDSSNTKQGAKRIVKKKAVKKKIAKKKQPVKGKEIVKKLTSQELVFVEQFVLTRNVVSSALKAGYSPTMAKTKCFCWVSEGKCPPNKIHVMKAITESIQEISEETKIDAAWVLRSAVSVHERCMQNEQAVDDEGFPIGEYKFEHAGANKALEIIGKHVDVQAFLKRIEVTENVDIAERLARSRSRNQGKKGGTAKR